MYFNINISVPYVITWTTLKKKTETKQLLYCARIFSITIVYGFGITWYCLLKILNCQFCLPCRFPLIITERLATTEYLVITYYRFYCRYRCPFRKSCNVYFFCVSEMYQTNIPLILYWIGHCAIPTLVNRNSWIVLLLGIDLSSILFCSIIQFYNTHSMNL